MSAITTHVLDTSLGKPAAGVPALLEKQSGEGAWTEAGRGVTDDDGRIRDLLKSPLEAGIYRLTFDTAGYFEARNTPSFFPQVIIVFEVRNAGQHHHVPLLLSPFGYSTYRGS